MRPATAHRYKREQIEWDFVDFPDNTQILELVEASPHGVLKLLDDECLVPSGSDEGFARKLYARSHAHLEVTPKLKRDHRFALRHYAGVVEYSSHGFVEKNRDAIFPEVRENNSLCVTCV